MTQITEPTTDTTSKTPVAKKPAAKKPAAKKASAKKPVAKKGAKPTAAKKGAPNEVFAKWKAGAKIAELVKTFKLTRPQVRRQLLNGAGSREAFKALRKQGAGGTLAKDKQGEAK